MKLMVIGFPKAGTTSITRALRVSGMKSAHWRLASGKFVGALIYDAVSQGLDPFTGLEPYDAITQADVCLPARKLSLWPNLDFAVLSAIRRAHPSCLFVLNYRRPEAICDSIAKWDNMQRRFEVSDIPGLPRGIGGERQHLMSWIENHYDACHSFFANDDRFLEVDIESPDVPERLGRALGIPILGWGDHKPLPNPNVAEKPLKAKVKRITDPGR